MNTLAVERQTMEQRVIELEAERDKLAEDLAAERTAHAVGHAFEIRAVSRMMDVTLGLARERAKVAMLREMIQYALDGPDTDLGPEHGGRAIDCCKKILRDALRNRGHSADARGTN